MRDWYGIQRLNLVRQARIKVYALNIENSRHECRRRGRISLFFLSFFNCSLDFFDTLIVMITCRLVI